VNPVHDESGALAYFVGIQSDVTQRRSLEHQLRQSQRMEAVGQLAGGIAHDFNNLLTIINGYSTLVLTTPDLATDIRESVTEIKDAGARASSLTRQLLGFSRRAIVQPEVLDLNEVIDHTSRLLRRLIGADISFTTALAPDLAHIKIDPGQLDQVLMNLAVNARDAMSAGGTLTIETANVDLGVDHRASHLDCVPGSHVMLAITDTGSGMAAEVLDHIFEPFFTTKEVGKGTGLGLSVVFGVVQQAGGCIDVQSEVGTGTTFRIYFPAVTVPVSRRSDPSLLPLVGGTETVLLVEDEAAVRGFAAASLRSQGYRVLTASDGLDAMGVVRAHDGPLELVVTDVVMPGTSGPDLVAQVRAVRPDIRVLYMSGYTDDSVVRHGLLASDVALIQKPFSPRDLVVRVRRVLDDEAR
jgi:nitrogen-specific signal transduction histidine kinase